MLQNNPNWKKIPTEPKWFKYFGFRYGDNTCRMKWWEAFIKTKHQQEPYPSIYPNGDAYNLLGPIFIAVFLRIPSWIYGGLKQDFFRTNRR